MTTLSQYEEGFYPIKERLLRIVGGILGILVIIYLSGFHN